MQLYACGSNGSSQLSLNHADDVTTLTRCIFHPSFTAPPDAKILDLVSSSTHSLLLLHTSSGNVLLGAGTNTLGQLGPRCALWDEVKPEGRFKPVSLAVSAGLEGDWEPVKIAATWTTSFVTYRRVVGRDDSSSASQNGASSSRGVASAAQEVIVGCGSNDFGELGQGGTGNGDRVAITSASDNATIVPVRFQAGESVEILRGGQRHVVAVLRGPQGQRVVGWGASRKGELDPKSASRGVKAKGKTAQPTVSPPTQIILNVQPGVMIRDVALGASHTLVLLSDGSVQGWGSDLKGQITQIDSMSDIKAIGATWGGSYYLTRGGELFSQGSNTHGQLLRDSDQAKGPGKVVVPRGSICDIVAGSEHLLVVVEDHGRKELWAGGWNEHGNLGLGHADDQGRLVKVDVPGEIKRVWGGLAATWVWTTAQED
ncbi:regulator of chromosome condensation 1/beta-lactamase-inhibitor protein II [Papiliotrema laurentii]|uniref:Regulator of chromosome condensation 1/beta-lactamase-inhibitor protein II n=1 Tax=Papiliotrema laurentii TaxID=5418 RepID=A0AAD9CU85_PAPLA|nr:regulator of chromosome condensation 1/beta-lactamase-inhibitor protein II [Papiliotrema laurentii]